MRQLPTRACLKKAFCKMCVTICGRFCPDEGVVAGYDNRIRAKYTAKWGVQIAGMLFKHALAGQTFRLSCLLFSEPSGKIIPAFFPAVFSLLPSAIPHKPP